MKDTVAKEILRQLGGTRFTMMTGSKNYSCDEYSLYMHLTRNKAKAKYLKIKLEATDTYTMTFSKLDKKKGLVVVSEHSMIYNDMLRKTFEEVTGLYTSL